MKHRGKNFPKRKTERSIHVWWDNFKQPNKYVAGVSEGNEREERERKNISRNNGQIFPKFDEDFKPIDPRSSKKHKH